MCGQCGSGKSYFARQLAQSHNMRYLAIDDTYAYFNGDPKCRDNKFQVWMTFYQQIHAAEMARQDVVIDVNNPCEFDRAEFLNWFPTFSHYLIWIDADWATAWKNNCNRDRVIPSFVFKSLFNAFEPPTYEEVTKQSYRAFWAGAFHIKNDDNHFGSIESMIGEWPYDIN